MGDRSILVCEWSPSVDDALIQHISVVLGKVSSISAAAIVYQVSHDTTLIMTYF